MMEKIIVTNLGWFEKYLVFRRIVLIVMFGAILLAIKPELISAEIKTIIQGISISILITLLLFNLLESPSYFELKQHSEKIVIGLYFPDTRYFINFNKDKIKYHTIKQPDEILFHLNSYALSLRNNLLLQIKKGKGEMIQFKPINLSWANSEDLKNIQRLFAEHNKALGSARGLDQ